MCIEIGDRPVGCFEIIDNVPDKFHAPLGAFLIESHGFKRNGHFGLPSPVVNFCLSCPESIPFFIQNSPIFTYSSIADRTTRTNLKPVTISFVKICVENNLNAVVFSQAHIAGHFLGCNFFWVVPAFYSKIDVVGVVAGQKNSLLRNGLSFKRFTLIKLFNCKSFVPHWFVNMTVNGWWCVNPYGFYGLLSLA